MTKSKKTQAKVDSSNDDQVTTVKVRQRTARLIREIGTLRKINQEDVLELFRDQLKAHVLRLLEQRTAEIKDHC